MNLKINGKNGNGEEGGRRAHCYPTGMTEKKGFESDFVQFVPVFAVADVRLGKG